MKITAWTAGSILGLALLLIAALLIVGNTVSGRRWIERTTASLTDGRVQLREIGGSFPSHLTLARLQLSDDRGVWLTAERIALDWSPFALLSRHVQVDKLEVDRLAIDRAPESKNDEKNTSTPSVPHTDLARMAIHELDLGPQLAGSAVSLVVTADAHLRSLEDATAHLVAHRSSGLGSYELALKFDPARMDASLQLREPANGPLENILKIPGLGDLSVQATIGGPREAEIIDVTLEAGQMHGRVQGSVNLPDKSAELTYALNADAMTPAQNVSWERIALQGGWHGPLTTPNASGRLEVLALKLPGATQLGVVNASLKAAGGLLSGHLVLDKVVIPGPNPNLLRESPVTLDATVHMNEGARPLQLTMTHTLFALRANARTAGDRGASVELSLPNLAPLAAMGGQDVKGSSTLKADVAYDGQVTKLTADAASQIQGGSGPAVSLLRGASRLQVVGEVDDSTVSVSKLLLEGNSLSLSVNGTAQRSGDRKLSARVALNLRDLARLSAGMAGDVRVNAKLDGPLADLAANADIASNLSVHGSPSGALTATMTAQGIPHRPRGTIDLHGDLDSSPVQLNVSVEQTGSNTAFRALIHRADWKSAHAEGDISGNDDLEQTRGRVAFHFTQLGDLDRLLGTKLRGGVEGTFAMRPDHGKTRADFHINATDVGTETVQASARVDGRGTVDALDLKVDGQSPAVAGKRATLTLASVLNMTAHTLRVNDLAAQIYGQDVALVAPMTLSFADGLALTRTSLKSHEATLEVEGKLSPDLDIRAAIHDIKPELVNSFTPELLAAGKIDGEATVQGTFARPTGRISLQAIGLRSASDVAIGLPAVDVHVGADLMGDTAKVDAKLTAGAKSQLTLGGQAPLAPTGALDLRLAGTLDLGLANPLLEAKGRHVEGQLSLDTSVNGQATDPQVGGKIQLAKGSFRDYTQGVNLTDIVAQIEGDQKSLRIVNLTAHAAPGTLSVTGTASVLDPGIPVDIELKAKNAQPITNAILTANIDSDIHVSGKAREHLDVKGTVHVNRADVGIPSGFPPNVAVLDVRRPGQAAPAPPEKPLVIGLDIRVQAPRQILVKGRGLDAELGGELRVRDTTDSPRVTGGFELQRGTFEIASSRLNFSSGSVTFNGAGLKRNIDPTLDFTAQASVSEGTATVRITGFADSPKIELSSSPDMPQDEILARLLFGVPAAQLTALQVVQIGAALAKLTGGGGDSLNPLAKIQKTLGLDRLSVSGGSSTGGAAGNNTNTGATIEAGRYVSQRVFVAVKESTTGVSQLAVDVDLTKHLKLQTRLGNGTATAQGTTPENDPGSSVGIAYTFEY
ncbi:MAG TPA: translocation/assembly module TamB domain-containing protein [Steroidobacteraceae bacterium]